MCPDKRPSLEATYVGGDTEAQKIIGQRLDRTAREGIAGMLVLGYTGMPGPTHALLYHWSSYSRYACFCVDACAKSMV